MSFLNRATTTVVLIASTGAAVGAFAGLGFGRAILFHTATALLSEYAQVLTARADDLALQVDTISEHVQASPASFCSAQDIALLQTETFRADGLKDVGRTNNGKLYCSAFLGQLVEPFPHGGPALRLLGDLNIYTNVPILMAAVGHNRATILEKGTTDAVLSPNAFARWDRPYAHYAIFAFDRSGNHSARIAGSDLSVTSKWLGSGELRVENGLIFQNQCSTSHPLCVVTTEPLAVV